MSGAKSRRRRADVLGMLMIGAIAVPLYAYLIWDLVAAGRVSFRSPWALLLLAAPALAACATLGLRVSRRPAMPFSSLSVLARLRRGLVGRIYQLPTALMIVAISVMVVALARPQTQDRGGRVEVEGIDILLALDLSKSMEARDLRPNRLQAAKKVIDAFIARRKSDRIGLVVFGKDAYTHCPLTLDYAVLRNMLGELELDLIDGRATAIGNALGVSLARLRKSDAKSRVVILVTDGENNAGNVTPQEAARYAAAMKVKVFTILMGPRKGKKQFRTDIFGRRVPVKTYAVNPKLLEEIAAKTGGKSYLADDRRALEDKFERILDELDKTSRRDVAAVFTDAFRPFCVVALLLVLLSIGLRLTRMREFP